MQRRRLVPRRDARLAPGEATVDAAALLRAIADAEASSLPAVIATLEEARAAAWRRLHEEAVRPRELKLLTVDEAADLARLPRRRIFSLARRASWAVRVGRRLLVEEAALRRALLADVRGEHETTGTPPPRARKRAVARVRASQ